jgi:hypothetical protein
LKDASEEKNVDVAGLAYVYDNGMNLILTLWNKECRQQHKYGPTTSHKWIGYEKNI